MSAQSTPLLTLSRLASSVIAAARFVTPANAQATAGANTLGVNRSAAAIGDRIAVDADGTAVVESGAAVADGATIASDATGRAITWASGAKIAVALEPATAAGQMIEVLLVSNAA